jgi:hypothetical protein
MIIKQCVVSTIDKESDISNCTIKFHASNSRCRDLKTFFVFVQLMQIVVKNGFLLQKKDKLSNEGTKDQLMIQFYSKNIKLQNFYLFLFSLIR